MAFLLIVSLRLKVLPARGEFGDNDWRDLSREARIDFAAGLRKT
jgi:hypothetical protein